MGTNYYVWLNGEEQLHIGKSSMGWVFSLRLYEDRGILSLYDWLPIILSNEIRDEYGRQIKSQEILSTITLRGRDEPVNWTEEEFKINHAEPGPNNLVRHRQMSDYGRTITHGEGTWDYMDYEFF